jgi:DNA-binding transcriptional MerR regulator
MRALSISELESLSGVRREVIYFYVRRGLLPQAQKASATRAIYTDEHVDLLRQIGTLKD